MKHSRTHFTNLERRNVLKVLLAGSTLALPNWVLGQNSIWAPTSTQDSDELALTPSQTEGPFYPDKTIQQELFNDTDLSRKLGDHEAAKGQLVVVEGFIKDQKGTPLMNSVVEVWQACASGRYHHSRDDRNPSLLDNNFQFWGRAITGDDGRYSFTTIIPGKYPGRMGRHIHFRVDAQNFSRCSTQCYFSEFGEDNMRDGIYKKLTREERKLVTVEVDKPVAMKTAEAQPHTNTANRSNEFRSSPKVDSAGPAQKEIQGAKRDQTKPWKGQFDIVLAKA